MTTFRRFNAITLPILRGTTLYLKQHEKHTTNLLEKPANTGKPQIRQYTHRIMTRHKHTLATYGKALSSKLTPLTF